jgi:hypothetical protein
LLDELAHLVRAFPQRFSPLIRWPLSWLVFHSNYTERKLLVLVHRQDRTEPFLRPISESDSVNKVLVLEAASGSVAPSAPHAPL